jgi:CMD domain protein
MSDTIDIIDHLAGVAPDTKGEGLRARRPVTREHAQKSWLALFEPADASQISVPERFAVATFVAHLHEQADIADFYAGQLAGLENGASLLSAVKGLAELNSARGPYGHYPAGPLTVENTDGPALNILPADRELLGEKLAAALSHAHLLVFRPREASPAALQALLDAGWSTTGIVTLSQLVSFLAFQIRVVAGLKTLAAA